MKPYLQLIVASTLLAGTAQSAITVTSTEVTWSRRISMAAGAFALNLETIRLPAPGTITIDPGVAGLSATSSSTLASTFSTDVHLWDISLSCSALGQKAGITAGSANISMETDLVYEVYFTIDSAYDVSLAGEFTFANTFNNLSASMNSRSASIGITRLTGSTTTLYSSHLNETFPPYTATLDWDYSGRLDPGDYVLSAHVKPDFGEVRVFNTDPGNYLIAGTNDFTFEFTPVPEPTTAFYGIATVFLGICRRRTTRRA